MDASALLSYWWVLPILFALALYKVILRVLRDERTGAGDGDRLLRMTLQSERLGALTKMLGE